MKTRRPYPEHGALVRARAILLEAGLELPVRSWTDLATICDTPWLPVLARPTPSSARILRRRLLRLSSPPLTVAAAAARPRGEIVHVGGQATGPAGGRAADPIWRVTRTDDRDGAWSEEEAEDFLVSDPEGGRLLVVASGGHLVGGYELRSGDAVSLFGFFDEIPDRTGLFASPHGRGGVAPALQSGSDWPLLVSRAGPPPPAGEPHGRAPVVP